MPSLEGNMWNTDDGDHTSSVSVPSPTPSRAQQQHQQLNTVGPLPSETAASNYHHGTASTISPRNTAPPAQQHHQATTLSSSGHRAKASATATEADGPSRPDGERPEVLDLKGSREADIRHLTPAVLLLLRGFLLLDPAEAFFREASWMYPYLADLVVVRSLEVRAAVRELLSRMGPHLRFPSTAGVVETGEGWCRDGDEGGMV